MKSGKTWWAWIGVVSVLAATGLYYHSSETAQKSDKSMSKTKGMCVGAVLPLTGPGGVFASYIKDGIDLAVRELKADGVNIHIYYEDSKNKPREGIDALRKLKAEHACPVSIVALSSVAKAVAPLAEKDRMVHIYTAVAVPGVADGKWRFRYYPDAYGMAGRMARYVALKLHKKRAAAIYINDDFGKASLDAFKKVFESLGGVVADSEAFGLMQHDFRSSIARLIAIKPPIDVIYVSGYGPAYGEIVRQLKESGISATITADMTMGLPNTLSQVGHAKANGIYFVDGRMSGEFRRQFVKFYQKKPTSYAGYAYDAVMLLGRAAKQGVFDSEGISNYLRKIDVYMGVMGRVHFDARGESHLEFNVNKIDKDGNIVNIN